MMKVGFYTIVILLLLFAFAGTSSAQSTRRVVALGTSHIRVVDGEGTRVQRLELASRYLRRKVWMSVLLPKDYFDPTESGRKYSVLYLLHGLSGRFDNWTTKSGVAEYVGDMACITVTPEGADGWYTDSATKPDDKFETYFVEEVIPEIDRRYRTIAEGRARVVAGLSMGGYGAIKFGLKYPDMFSIVGSFSGALDAPLRTEKSPFLRPSITSVFGPDDSNTRAANDIFAIVRNATTENIKKFPFIYLDCGTEDPFLSVNREFDALLVEKKVPHEFRELPGKHEWAYWDRQIREFLRVASSR